MTGERVFEALTDCADELEGEIVARYVHADGVHPAMQHKYDRDMQTVIDARLAIDTLRAQVAALAGAKVYTVEWSDYDGHGIIAAFKTHEEADAELAYCKGAPDDFAPSYYTSEYTLGLSEACSLYRFNADGALMHTYFFTRLGDEERGTVRVYNEPWNDGTCMDVYARSEADARAAIAQHLDAARGGEG